MAVARFDEIAELVAQSGSRRVDVADLEPFARKLFQSLWRLDFLAMGLKSAVAELTHRSALGLSARKLS